MKSVNIHAAKTNLSKLVEQAALGEAFIIAKAGKPMVRVLPMEAQAKPSRLGGLEGVFKIPEDFDTMYQEEIIRMFEGEAE
jgi:prevent-host-death family protein